ncbi:DUF6130 family protein [Massilia sp. UYP11]|uniref:DUF6130 family protein n=1 Tax=Massilia sp. UYP11 TaxID=1756385 RepID=UPI003D1D3DBA
MRAPQEQPAPQAAPLRGSLALPESAHGDACGSHPIAVVAIRASGGAGLTVDQPLPGPLAPVRFSIGYRTGNIRLVPVYGTAIERPTS